MAKMISPVFKFKGTIGGVTHVDSPTYGNHSRSERGTFTPITINKTLQQSRDLVKLCNQRAKPLYQFLKNDHHDSMLWSRLVALFFKDLKATGTINVRCLQNFECNLKHKLDELLKWGYEVDVKKGRKQLQLQVRLGGHPFVDDKLPRDGYRIRLVVLYPDFVKDTVRKEQVLSSLVAYGAALEPVDFTVPMPSAKTPYVVLMGINPVIRGDQLTVQADAALKVVAV